MAALDFPATPADGQIYTANGKTYRYNSASTSWTNITGVGYTGSIGYTGSQGTTGYFGSRGDLGYTGSRGYTGSIGYTGSAGTNGYTGSQGVVGYSGSAGTNGYTGSQGVVGYSGSRGALLPWSLKTANYTAVDGDRFIAKTTAGTFTVTLPATPVAGAYVQIADGDNWFTNNLLINRNGSTIEGIADNVAINIANVSVEFIYDGTTWQFVCSAGPEGPTGPTGPIGPVNNSAAIIYSIALS